MSEWHNTAVICLSCYPSNKGLYITWCAWSLAELSSLSYQSACNLPCNQGYRRETTIGLSFAGKEGRLPREREVAGERGRLWRREGGCRGGGRSMLAKGPSVKLLPNQVTQSIIIFSPRNIS